MLLIFWWYLYSLLRCFVRQTNLPVWRGVSSKDSTWIQIFWVAASPVTWKWSCLGLIAVLGSVKEIQLSFAIVWDFIKFSENIQIWLFGQIYLLKSLLFEIWRRCQKCLDHCVLNDSKCYKLPEWEKWQENRNWNSIQQTLLIYLMCHINANLMLVPS